VRHAAQGRAVQVDRIKPKSKARGTNRLKLAYDELLSNFAFKFNLRHYIKENGAQLRMDFIANALCEAGAYTRLLSSST
jgi:hypothetical protein